MSQEDEDPNVDGDMDALIAAALVKKGELIPTTSAEVRAAEDGGVAYGGELPASLREFGANEAGFETKSPQAGGAAGEALSQRVVSIDELRRARAKRRDPRVTHFATFAVGAAIAASVVLYVRTPRPEVATHEQGGATTPSANNTSEPSPAHLSIGPMHTACGDCCAGSACNAAKGELRACSSGRTCVACGDGGVSTTAYRVRIASLTPAKALDGRPLASLDVCGRVLSGEWSCMPAYAEPSQKPPIRSFAKLASVADLASGLEIELRTHDTKDVVGHWGDSVRLGATVLCRGVGALLTNDKREDIGSIALALDDPYYVEIARAGDVDSLKKERAKLEFADVTPALVETSAQGARRFALVAGPFDSATADKLRWALLEKSEEATTTLGDDHEGAILPLP